MRFISLSAFLAVPVLLVACSNGGPGSPGKLEGAPGGFGVGGGSLPASGTGGAPTPAGGGGGGGGGQVDSGGGGDQDTGGGGNPDTGGGGGGGACAAKCPSDPDRTEAEIAKCNSDSTTGPCAAQYKAAWECYASKRVCSAAGTTDQEATQAACSAEISSLSTCLSGGA